MNSSICIGSISHCRHQPTKHSFSYRASMLYFDLDELDELSNKIPFFSSKHKFFPVSFSRSDYFKPEISDLKKAIHVEVQKHIACPNLGAVRVLTQPRYWGFVFNPVSFYFVYTQDEDKLCAVVAEITNTPWGERHHYCLKVNRDSKCTSSEWKFSKAFHVSPFMPMNVLYQWKFTHPNQGFDINMKNFIENKEVFEANLSMQREEMHSKTLLKVLVLYPLMTIKIIMAIYWHALLLKLKGTPFCEHPKYNLTKGSLEV